MVFSFICTLAKTGVTAQCDAPFGTRRFTTTRDGIVTPRQNCHRWTRGARNRDVSKAQPTRTWAHAMSMSYCVHLVGCAWVRCGMMSKYGRQVGTKNENKNVLGNASVAACIQALREQRFQVP
ncbi:hypothetical protein E2C01_038352 [Portunus trituberculatus]|uniref:Secreted protein n=1 Tax=Portunus trituberculatus TaxID=210409 RepID=A0A5B7FJZ1_PORTR|nr:hypothetical protein [Portunus trituberculatus]